MKTAKYLGLGTCLIILVGASYLGYFLKQVAPFASGFSAHTFCSNLFIAKRPFKDIEEFDLATVQQLLTRSSVDGNTVTTEFGIWPINYTSVAVYRRGLGCGQLAGGNLTDLEGPESIERVLPEQRPDTLAWPALNTEGVDTHQLSDLLDRAFSDTAESYQDRKNTRAMAVSKNKHLFSSFRKVSSSLGVAFNPPFRAASSTS